MHDWNLLNNSNFRTVSAKFKLAECLAEVYEMMKTKASIKNLRFDILSDEGIPNQVIGDKLRL